MKWASSRVLGILMCWPPTAPAHCAFSHSCQVSEIRQSLVDMDAMLRVLAAPSANSPASGNASTSTDLAATGAAEASANDLEATPAASAPLPHTPPSIVFDRVSFTYPNASAPALVEASFHAPAAGTTALVGLSGSGKSTCLRLISRLCDANAGRVLVWDRDVHDVSPPELRASLGFIPQDPWLADDTLEWNVRMGKIEATDEAVEAAIAAASLTQSVAALPNGYRSRVGERGGRLSGGEKQRTMIARALLRDAPLLLADEPTASADALTEAAIVESLRRGTSTSGVSDHGASSGTTASPRTLVVVVHRLAALCPTADNIVVFRQGRVVEQGVHTDLLSAGGEYAQLWRAQAAEDGAKGVGYAPPDGSQAGG